MSRLPAFFVIGSVQSQIETPRPKKGTQFIYTDRESVYVKRVPFFDPCNCL
jgi:hypothetical protein